MDPQKQKEQFNYAYMCALAAHAGLNRVDAAVDDDSIDVSFKGKGYRGQPVRSPQIEFQLKCTSQDLVDGDVIKFPLSRKNFDDLRGSDFASPRYLAVLLVPTEIEAWIDHSVDHIALFNNCYWLSLRDAAPTENEAQVTVAIPLAQRLTSTALREMIDRASQGEWL
ncbi:MAG: hypothetical protein NVS3B3_10200 [Aquirhabdus sp.]